VNSGPLPPGGRLDELEAKLVRCLQIAPRARFNTIGDVLEVSEQTVARRYRKLLAARAIRVRGYVPIDVGQQDSWVVRVRCGGSSADELAARLAARRDVRWVAVCSGGTEIVALLMSPDLDNTLNGASYAVLAHALVLHRFTAQPRRVWAGLAGLLTSEQEQALREDAIAAERPEPDTAADAFDEHDAALIDALAEDGRTTVSALAKRAGLSEGRAARRMELLMRSGLLALRIDLTPTAFGIESVAVLWLDIAPRHLDEIGRVLVDEPQVITVLALSGEWNLGVLVACADAAALYEFVVTRLGAHEQIRATDVSPVVRRPD
jgi:DNA-binding Lrp family transcriptional regulator